MNHKSTAVAAVVIALALTLVVFTIPTREALAWGFFGSTKVDQRINQLNNCTNSRPDNTYKQSSYDPSTNNKPSTDNSQGTSLSQTHGNTKNQVITSEDSSDNKQPSNKQTSTDSHGNTKNQVITSEDSSDNKQPSNYAGDDKNNDKSTVLCVNKANNLAQID
jgi:hypothetical protein